MTRVLGRPASIHAGLDFEKDCASFHCVLAGPELQSMLNADANLLADTEPYVPAQQPVSVREQVKLLTLWESKPKIYVYHNGVASLSAIFDGEDTNNARWYDGDDVSFAKYTEHPLFRDPSQLYALLQRLRSKLGYNV